MKRAPRRWTTTRVVALALAVPAHAAAEPEPFEAGRVTLRSAVELGESSSLALDGWYGVNDRFRLAVTTSDDARRELGSGRGLCLAACTVRFGGLAGAAEVQIGPTLVGRAALDTDRFAPTIAALELGADVLWQQDRWAGRVSPSIRLGIARRDLDDNRDRGAVYGELGPRLSATTGVMAIARLGGSLDHVTGEPTFGAGGGVWWTLGAITLSARGGAAHLSRRDSLFAEIAFAWSR